MTNILFNSRNKVIVKDEYEVKEINAHALWNDYMIDDCPEREARRKVFLVKLREAEMRFNFALHSGDVDDKQYNNYFNEIIDIVNDNTIDCCKLDYSKIKAGNNSNRNITWEYVQSTDNAYDKYTFAKKVHDRCLVALDNISDINLLVNLDFSLGLITNVKNFYFNFDKEEAIQRSFNHRYKRFNAIFRDEVKALAMDYRKFYDINRFSEESICDGKDIRITQEQGLEFVEIGNLICNLKLKQAYDKVIEVGLHVKDVPWLE